MTYNLLKVKEIKQALAWLSEYWDKPTHPEYFHARSIEEVISLSEEYGKESRILAGATDVMGLMKNKVIAPRALISLKNIPGLSNIHQIGDGLAIGTLVTINELEDSDLLKKKYPILSEAAHSIGSPQIRNMATLGGNLLQDVRCWYYRRSPLTGNVYNCRRKNESGQCYAANSENQYHAIMGGCKCFAVCPSDMAAALLALDARVHTVNAEGGRSLAIDELYTDLGHRLKTGEVASVIQVPEVSSQARQRFQKFRIRQAIDFAIVSVASVITVENNTIKDARIVLGGVSYKPYRAFKAEEILKGEKVTENLAIEAAKAALKEASPLSQNTYKVPIAEALVKRSILE